MSGAVSLQIWQAARAAIALNLDACVSVRPNCTSRLVRSRNPERGCSVWCFNVRLVGQFGRIRVREAALPG